MTKPSTDLISAPVWDIFVRCFHWSLVVLFAAAVITGEVGGNAIVWHMRCGYAILTLVTFRLIWGFVGGEYARFGSFLSSPGKTIAFAKNMFGKGHDYVVGHNPLGGWMVLALLLTLATQATLGLFANDEIATTGPLAQYVSEATSVRLTGIHHIIGKVLLVLVGLHVAAVLFHLFVKKENLIRAMFSGNKSLPADLAREAQGARKASTTLGFAVFVLVIALVAVIVNWSVWFK